MVFQVQVRLRPLPPHSLVLPRTPGRAGLPRGLRLDPGLRRLQGPPGHPAESAEAETAGAEAGRLRGPGGG